MRTVSLYFVNNWQFLVIMFVWLAVGMKLGPIVYPLILLTILLFKYKERYKELFISFFFLLILSDNLQHQMSFATTAKNFFIVLLAGILLFDSKNFVPFNRFFYPFIFFFIYIFLILIKSDIFITGLMKTTSYVLLFLIVPNFISKLYREQGPGFLKEIIYFGLLILIAGLVLIMFSPNAVFVATRFNGVFGNPNALGLFCVLLFLFTNVIYYYQKQLFQKHEIYIILGIIFISVILCGSRNSIFTIAIFYLFFQFFRFSPYLSAIFLASIIVGNILLTINIASIIQAIGLENYFRLESLEGGSGRKIAWDFAWEKIQDHFFFGKGFAYDTEMFNQNFQMLSLKGHMGGVHNSYLSFWLNTGIVGLILFFGAFVKKFFDASKLSFMAFPIMYAILFSITFESWMIGSLNPFTIIFLMIMTLLTTESFVRKKEDTVSIQ